MKKTKFEFAQLVELLKTLRAYNNEIGSYEEHLILTDDGTYSIKLTNGSITHLYGGVAGYAGFITRPLKRYCSKIYKKKMININSREPFLL